MFTEAENQQQDRQGEMLAEMRAINQQLAGINHLLAILANQNQQQGSASQEKKEPSIYDGIDGVSR